MSLNASSNSVSSSKITTSAKGKSNLRGQQKTTGLDTKLFHDPICDFLRRNGPSKNTEIRRMIANMFNVDYDEVSNDNAFALVELQKGRGGHNGKYLIKKIGKKSYELIA